MCVRGVTASVGPGACVRVCVCVCVCEGSGRVCGARCACVCVGGVAASEGSDLPGAPSDSHRHWERAGLRNRSPRFLKVQALRHLVLRLPPLPQHSANKALEAGELSLPSPQDLRLCLCCDRLGPQLALPAFLEPSNHPPCGSSLGPRNAGTFCLPGPSHVCPGCGPMPGVRGFQPKEARLWVRGIPCRSQGLSRDFFSCAN